MLAALSIFKRVWQLLLISVAAWRKPHPIQLTPVAAQYQPASFPMAAWHMALWWWAGTGAVSTTMAVGPRTGVEDWKAWPRQAPHSLTALASPHLGGGGLGVVTWWVDWPGLLFQAGGLFSSKKTPAPPLPQAFPPLPEEAGQAGGIQPPPSLLTWGHPNGCGGWRPCLSSSV